MLIRRMRSLVVKAVIEVTTVVVEGYADEDDLVAWLNEAIARHHTFRAGYINSGDRMAGIVNPIVKKKTP